MVIPNAMLDKPESRKCIPEDIDDTSKGTIWLNNFAWKPNKNN